MKTRKERAEYVGRKLEELYPENPIPLDHTDAFTLLIAVLLSAQCTDKRVNMVTPELFKRYSTPEKLGRAKQEDVEKVIHSTGFYRNKAKSLIASSNDIVAAADASTPSLALASTPAAFPATALSALSAPPANTSPAAIAIFATSAALPGAIGSAIAAASSIASTSGAPPTCARA